MASKYTDFYVEKILDFYEILKYDVCPDKLGRKTKVSRPERIEREDGVWYKLEIEIYVPNSQKKKPS